MLHKKRNVKGDIFNLWVLITTLVAIFLFVFFASCVAKYVGLTKSTAGIDSYNGLTATIAEVWANGGMDIAAIKSEKNNMFAFFGKSDSELQVGATMNFIERPNDCGKDAGCICLCQETRPASDAAGLPKLECTKKTCSKYDFDINAMLCVGKEFGEECRLRSKVIESTNLNTIQIWVEKGKENIFICNKLEQGECLKQ